MNELQQVLIIFAIIVIVGLYFLQKKKNASSKASSSQTAKTNADESSSPAVKDQAGKALNELGEAHIPVSAQTQHRLHVDEEDVPENQLGLSFGEGFEPPKKENAGETSLEVKVESTESISEQETDEAQNEKKPKHIVIKDENMVPVDGFQPDSVDVPDFGVPTEPSSSAAEIAQQKTNVEKTEPQVFALIVMGTEDFLWPKVNQTLQGVGLVTNGSQIFVKNDSMGNEIIRVANLLEPGSFPIEEPANNDYKTPGVVLILELPTTVKAPAVMHDMIMMARKISQRLNGRLYNAERHLIKESDLQQMRDTAVAYESQAIK
ncbi:cell division protein ZipA C-terminal FtsZ-binding domain-containing protein [Hydrogenovibrio kuenenii]|uniref:cell division protein ZipA C-terminal FtsZ-binding domain-containing protein n=1 Tax=Hydrogenovibrio kuenenii TaxID=63658 RepID=UPI000464E60E|nr:cell division protein ZipA C-terminal FtsZ-binding domain-containing protein [Hydrogenovibrio kuenenii]